MNNREWIEEQKRKLVQIDRQERRDLHAKSGS